MFVHDSVYDEFVGQLVERVGRYEPGDGTVKAEKPRLRMGPIHTRAGRDELLAQIEDGVAKGGELLIGGGTGGHDKGCFLEPAVVAEPGAGSRLVTEEVFGPVLPVFRYSDFDDAIRRANDTRYGLGSSIWTHDVRKIHRAAQEIDAGMTWVNQIHYGYDELPFGGIKDSGFGKEHGMEALDSYVELKSRRRRRPRLMAVTFSADGPVGTITLDNPPANSYDIEFVTRARRRDRRGRRRRDVARGRRAQREREVLLRRRRRQALPRQRRRREHGDDPRSPTTRSRGIARSPQAVRRLDRRPRARRRPRDRARLRPALRGRGRASASARRRSRSGSCRATAARQRLPRIIGRGPALDLLLTGRQVTPDEALRARHRRRAVRRRGRVRAPTCEKLAAGPPLAIAHIKRASTRGST